MVIAFEGTPEEFWQKIGQIVDERIQANSAKKTAPLTKKQVCEQLGISFNTLTKITNEMKLEVIFPADLDRILLKYPKYIKKSNRA